MFLLDYGWSMQPTPVYILLTFVHPVRVSSSKVQVALCAVIAGAVVDARVALNKVGAAALCALALGAAPAVAQTSVQPASVQQPGSTAALEARRKVLLASMLSDPGNLDIAFEYAALSAQVGDFEGAVSTLERMLIFAPGLPRLQLELGVLYFRLGAYEPALSYFNGALAAPDVPPEVRSKVEEYIAAIEKRSETSGVSGAISLGARYQTNANSAPSNPRIMLNNTPFTLTNESLGAPDANLFIAGSFRAIQDLQSQGDQMVATLQAYGAVYRDLGRLNTGVIQVSLGPSFDLRRYEIEDARFDLYGLASGVLLGTDPYLASGGAGVRLTKGLGDATELRVELEAVRNAYLNSTARPLASNSNGYSIDGSIGLEHQVTPDLKLFALLSGERRQTERGYLSAWQGGVTIGTVLGFDAPLGAESEDWALTVSGGVVKRVHDAPDPVINLNAAQTDEEVFAQAGLSVPIKEGWSIEASTSYRTVMSNYDLADSENISASLATMKRF